MPVTTTTGNRRRNEERAAMVQSEIENQRPIRWNALFNWRKYLKIFGSVFLIIMGCGVVAYASTAAIWYFFEEHLVITDTTSKIALASTNSNSFGDSFSNYASYLLVFVLGCFATSAIATTCWYFWEKHSNNSTRSRPKTSARTVSRITRPSTTTFNTHSLTSIEPIEESSPFHPTQERLGPFRIVGFYDSWSKYEIRGRQLQKLTHVIFSALDMNSAGTLSFHDYGIRKKFTDLVEMSKRVNPSLKIMFSIGEYAYASNFEAVVADPEKRKTLSNSIASLIQTHKVNGVDLFWKWPTKVENRDLFVLLLQEIRQKLNSISDSDHQYILSVVLPNFDWPDFKLSLDLNGIIEQVDFINVRTINYYGFWNSQWGAYTGPPSPLYSGLGAYGDSNVNYTITHYMNETGAPGKLNMGVPFFGAHWENVEGPIGVKEEMWFTAKAKTGEETFEGEYIPWREMEGWNLSAAKWHQESRCPFIWLPDERKFLGFENQRSLKEKMKYALKKSLGGITIWSVEMDDDLDTLLNSVQV